MEVMWTKASCGKYNNAVRQQGARPARWLFRHDFKRLFEDFEDLRQFMTALQDVAAGGDNLVHALFARQCRVLLHIEHRHFTGAPEDRKHSAVLQMIDRIIAPFSSCHLETVDSQNGFQLSPIERDLLVVGLDARDGRGGSSRRGGRKRIASLDSKLFIVLRSQQK